MTCPLCGSELDVSQPVQNVVICPACLRSLVLDGDTVRVAHGDDTVNLLDRELSALKAIRKSYRGKL